MKRLILGLVVLALAAAATAGAGGWATVGLSSLPTGLDPGERWTVDLTILQHARTPLAGVQPKVTITSETGRRIDFAAEPTAKKGIYRAEVVFPTAGTWRYAVDDDFSQIHTFAPVEIGAAVAPAAGVEAPAGAALAPDPDSFPVWPVLAVALVALAGAAAGLWFRRHGGRAPAATR